MSAVRWAWLLCGLLTAVTTEGQRLKTLPSYMNFKAEKVHFTQGACSQTYSVGNPYGNWKRVMFSPDMTCTGKFRCKLTFRLSDFEPLASDICVDYSRIKVHGRKSSLLLEDDSDDAFRERLTERRYPLTEQYMSTMLCIPKDSSLHLTFRSDCSQPPDQSFEGWMYVFVQTSSTGSIYFVDGDARHRHKMSVGGQPLVSLRSHVWTDLPPGTAQTSSMRISVAGSARVCFEWCPFVTPIFPPGVHVRLYKTYFNRDSVQFMYLTLPEGDGTVVPWHRQDCYYLSKVFEVVVEVSRDASVPVERSWKEEGLLFELVIGVNNQGNRAYGAYIDGTFTETTTRRLDSTTPVNGTSDWMSSVRSFLDRHKVEIGLGAGGIVLLVILYCCCRRCCSQRNRAKDPDTDAVLRRNTSSARGAGGTGGGAGRDAGAGDSIPMMARVMPSAPPLNDIEENPLRECDGPPAYADVFPDKV